MSETCADCGWHEAGGGHSWCRVTRYAVSPDARACELARVDLSRLDACVTCSHYIGLGDWGLDCGASYNILCSALVTGCGLYDRGHNRWGMTEEMLEHGALGIGMETDGD